MCVRVCVCGRLFGQEQGFGVEGSAAHRRERQERRLDPGSLSTLLHTTSHTSHQPRLPHADQSTHTHTHTHTHTTHNTHARDRAPTRCGVGLVWWWCCVAMCACRCSRLAWQRRRD